MDIGVFDGRVVNASGTRTSPPPTAGATRPEPEQSPDGATSAGNAEAGRAKPWVWLFVTGLALAVVGLVALGYGIYQGAYTGVIAEREQTVLAEQFEDRRTLPQPSAPDASAVVGQPITLEASGFEDPEDVPIVVGTVEVGPPSAQAVEVQTGPAWIYEAPPAHGEALGRIVILQADVDWIIVEGVDVPDLRRGPGHMPNTAVPGQLGNAVISGHRTTYGAPFGKLDRLNPGDRFTVETAIGVHTFEVVDVRIVAPTDTWVTGQWDGAWLTLTTCHPKYSSRQRLVVMSRLVAGPNAQTVADEYGYVFPVPQPPA